MKKTALLIFSVLGLVSCSSQPKQAPDFDISYDLSFDTENHYINVEMTFIGTPQEVVFRMPVWAPGYYIILDYPKHLSDFAATRTDGTPLKWDKCDKNAWVVETADTTKISYRIFANMHSVAESRVNDEIKFITGNGTYMYVEDHKDHPVSVTFELADPTEHISTGLKHLKDAEGAEMPYTFYAPDFDVLYDSPCLIGHQYVKTFNYEGHDYEFALETPEGFEDSPFEQDFKTMVSAATKLMGDVPYDNYCLIHMGMGGGGLEHANSQACYTSGSFNFKDREDYLEYLSFTTHEYFHLYNVKSIRPIELGPFNYDREVCTPLLWISEGFTVYYEYRILVDAGLMTDGEMLERLSGNIRSTQTTEGRKHQSLRQSSYDIWLNFFNLNPKADDLVISYYIKGPVVALLMDCRIKQLSGGERSLDDLMRLLYNRYYKEQGRGFTEDEFWASVEEVAGGKMDDIRRYVDTTDEIDYDTILNPSGLTLDHDTWTLSRNATE